ncbi:MAG: hypothetical protein J3R72DRAFT_427955 [Linnemannia gamsii]|nr:MAG: hypothetical protein J3R72DRAFT_427955 [Linnemannia gamsii]
MSRKSDDFNCAPINVRNREKRKKGYNNNTASGFINPPETMVYNIQEDRWTTSSERGPYSIATTKNNNAAIIGGVIGAGAVAFLLVVGVLVFRKQCVGRKQAQEQQENNQDQTPSTAAASGYQYQPFSTHNNKSLLLERMDHTIQTTPCPILVKRSERLQDKELNIQATIPLNDYSIYDSKSKSSSPHHAFQGDVDCKTSVRSSSQAIQFQYHIPPSPPSSHLRNHQFTNNHPHVYSIDPVPDTLTPQRVRSPQDHGETEPKPDLVVENKELVRQMRLMQIEIQQVKSIMGAKTVM